MAPTSVDAARLDPNNERGAIAEALLRSSARLIGYRDAHTLVGGVCEALTRASVHLPLAWTWFGPADTPLLAPQVCAGRAAGYGRTLVIRRNLLTQRGPAFRALAGHAAEPFGISPHALFGPWRQAAREHAIRNVLAVPLHGEVPGQAGVFVLYADCDDYFAQVGVSLFDAVGELLAGALSLSVERRELERAVYHDALTGALNRHALPLVERRLLRSAQDNVPSSLLLLDLDHFKRVNDEHGHAVGDAVLQATAAVLRDVLRSDDRVIRWGGEEFLACLPATHAHEARLVAAKITQAVRELRIPHIGLTVSIGLAEIGPGESLLDAVTRADGALYAAKASGRNCIIQAEPGAPAA